MALGYRPAINREIVQGEEFLGKLRGDIDESPPPTPKSRPATRKPFKRNSKRYPLGGRS